MVIPGLVKVIIPLHALKLSGHINPIKSSQVGSHKQDPDQTELW